MHSNIGVITRFKRSPQLSERKECVAPGFGSDYTDIALITLCNTLNEECNNHAINSNKDKSSICYNFIFSKHASFSISKSHNGRQLI